MPPAARVTDMHTCPMVTGIVPHVGGPILPPGVPTVLIDFLPAAHVTSMATCVGPPDIIVIGSAGVLIGFLPAARLGDPTAHGGVIILGSPTCIIGEIGSPSPGMGGMGGVIAGLVVSGGRTILSESHQSIPKRRCGPSTGAEDQRRGALTAWHPPMMPPSQSPKNQKTTARGKAGGTGELERPR